jgi:predicted nucleic acid-binding protein
MMTTSFSVILDACVLVPITLCDTLLKLAEQRMYRPLWSDEILAETERNAARFIAANGSSTEAALAAAKYRRTQMEQAFPEASIQGYESLVSCMKNQQDDRHVLAAAVLGHAQVIVTNNTRDFPLSALEPYQIERKTADEFLIDLLGFDPQMVVDAIKDMAAQKTRPPVTNMDMLKRIAKSAPNFAASVILYIESLPH